MKKLIFRKVKIVKDVPVDFDRWWNERDVRRLEKSGKKPRKKPLSQRLKEQRDTKFRVKWFVLDKVSGEELTRLDTYEQAKQYCIKNDYDFGQYL